MHRRASKTDVFTLIGMMATIAGILVCLFFLFTPATFGAMDRDLLIEHSPDLNLSMRWIQPILGQAIVEDALIRQRSNAAVDATALLDGSVQTASGSVQWMLGRVIVELNRSRMASGLPGHQNDDHRIVSIARHAAEQFHMAITAHGRMADRVADRGDLVL